MKVELNKLGKIKQGLHVVQAVVIFIAWALTLAVLTKGGQTGGATYYYFALCFLSVPALIYQICVPIYPRAARFAIPYIYAVIDAVWTILWFAAFVAVSVWDNAGISQGKSDNTASDGTCSYWAYGSASKCMVSKASVGLGVLLWLLFAGTLAISVMLCRSYRQDGARTGAVQRPGVLRPVDDASKDVWSANIEDRDEHEDEMDDRHRYGQVSDDDEERLLHKGSSYNMQIPELRSGAPQGYESSDMKTQYAVPSALIPGGHDDGQFADRYQPHRPPPRGELMSFPPGRYDRI